MKLIFKEVTIFKKKVPLVVIIWFAMALIAALSEVLRSTINNYLIFKYVFWHSIYQKNLYTAYPNEYADTNHYGPFFSFIIAPFAVLPNWLGCLLWCLVNAYMLFYAIERLHISPDKKLIILAITAIEMMTAIHNLQFNPMSAAWIILAFVLVEEEKDFWATLFIAAGFLVKLYGIGALLFFVFSKHKMVFTGSFIFWMIVLVCIPMLYSSPSYIIESYKHWYESLVEKNNENIGGYSKSGYQDISVMGMARRIAHDPNLYNSYFLMPAALLITAPLLRLKQYAIKSFRLSYLAIVLISVVIFSSSAESSTYVIAVPGAAIWYVLHYKKQQAVTAVVLILLFILSILSPTDLCPTYIKDHIIRAYSLKALPCFIVWVWLIAEVAVKNFTLKTSTNQQQ
jgi:hypothetical protein